MKLLRNLPSNILIIAVIFSILLGCSPAKDTANQPTDPINEIRKLLDLPELPLEFVENAGMTNSPSGRLEVANYRDSEGRIYSVNLETNQVVEIDARAILANIPLNTPALSAEEVKAKTITLAKMIIPDFDSLQSSLEFEEGGKVDHYFFTWYGEMSPDSMNRPFLQFGFHKSGVLFAYYNTLAIEK